MLEEHASGADRSRPVLARLLRDIAAGETLVVVRLDRLARSVSHLLAVIEQLEAKRRAFPQPARPDRHHHAAGHVLPAGAGRRRPARAGADRRAHQGRLLAARSRGRVGGNPGLRAGDPAAIRKVRASRDAAHLDGVLAQLDTWLPTVRRMRPDQPWGDVVRVLNRGQGRHLDGRAASPHGAAVWRSEGSSRRTLLDRARPQPATIGWSGWSPASRPRRPIRTLQQIAAQLEAMRERTPRGGTRWHPSSVKHLL